MFVTILVGFVGYFFYLSTKHQREIDRRRETERHRETEQHRETERRRQTPKPTIIIPPNSNTIRTKNVIKLPSPPRSHKKDSRIAHK